MDAYCAINDATESAPKPLNQPAHVLEKPAAAGEDGEARWSGTPNWYLWDGGHFSIGRSEGVLPSHAHHAIQIVITVEGTVGIRGKRGGDWRMGNGVVVRPDVVHAYNANGAVGAMVFVEATGSMR